jgi:PAS domain S-box-containing protein
MTDRDQPADDGSDLSSGSGASVGPALRSRAEESLRRQSSLRVARAEAVLPESAQRTLHELRVSQIELEMQNEELRNAQVALEEARARNVELYDLAPVGYCTVSRQGLILEANLSAATLLGIDRTTLIGQPLSRYIAGDDADHFHLQRRQILDTGEPLAGELRMTTAAGTPFWAQLAARAAAGRRRHAGAVCRVERCDCQETGRARTRAPSRSSRRPGAGTYRRAGRRQGPRRSRQPRQERPSCRP